MERNDRPSRADVAWGVLLLLCAPGVLPAQRSGTDTSGADPLDQSLPDDFDP